METINRAFDSASHAIWGETHPEHQQHGEEPLSGVQGQGKATDPYDAGNRDVQPDAPSTKSPTATTPAAQKESVHDPTGRSSEPLSSAVSEDADSQVGGYPRPGTNGFTSAGLASGVPEEPGQDADPVLDGGESSGVDPKSVSQAQRQSQNQYQGMANATGVPEGEQRTVMGSNPPGLNSRTSMGPGLGAMGEPSAPVAGGSAGGAAGAGAGVGGGTAAAGSTAGRGSSGTSQATEQRASSGGGSGSGKSVQYGKPTSEHQVSEEALKGPQGPPPEKYGFEKEMEGKPPSKGVGGGGQSQPQGGKAQNGNGGHHHFKAMEKVKEKMGRATKAGTHK